MALERKWNVGVTELPEVVLQMRPADAIWKGSAPKCDVS